MIPQENGNEPSKQIVIVKPCCPSCKQSEGPVVSTAGAVVGPLVCQVFFCGNCGAIYSVQIIAKQEEAIVKPSLVMPGRM
jgi:transposase-like protein